MHVVVDGIVFQSRSIGGISRLYNEVLPRLCDLDSSVNLTVTTAGRCLQPLPQHSRIKHFPLFPIDNLLRPKWFWWPVLQPTRAWLQHRATDSVNGDVWHSTYYTLPGKWDGSIIITVPDMIHEQFPQFFPGTLNDQFRQQKKRCILSADQIICISETTRQDVIRHYGLDVANVHAVPLACSPIFRQIEDIDPINGCLLNKPFILYVGSRWGYKNFTVLLQAYGKWNHRSKVNLVVVGPSWSKVEERQLSVLDCAENVHLLGHVKDHQLCSLYNNALAFVFPSLYEGFGIPLLEAMACGCPIVASKIPSTMEIINDCPVYFESTNEESLITALNTVLEEGRNSQRVKSGLEIVRHYTWERTAQETLKVYYDHLGAQK